MRHGGNMQLRKIIKDSVDMYRVDMWNAKIARQANHPEVKSLGNEIGLLRMLMEEKLRSCTNDTQLILHSPAISDLVMKIERVVVSCNKLEKSMGQHLDKAALLQFASQVVRVISEHVTDKKQVDLVAQGILEIISETEGDDGQK
jgi:predicted phosphohydrolase